VRVAVQAADIALYRRLQGDNKLEAWSSMFPSGNYPDSGNIFNALFTGTAMKYFNDDVIASAMTAGEAEFDAEKRASIYQRAYNRINEMNYHLAISSVPTVYLHSKDVAIKPNLLSVGENYIADYVWN
jgi:ABC-type transport system substrate-binding protein